MYKRSHVLLLTHTLSYCTTNSENLTSPLFIVRLSTPYIIPSFDFKGLYKALFHAQLLTSLIFDTLM